MTSYRPSSTTQVLSPLFIRSGSLLLRSLLLIALSVLLMLANQRSSQFQAWRAQLAAVVIPIQYLIHWPIRFSQYVSESLTRQESLLRENENLRAQQLLLQAQLQKFHALKDENTELRTLLSTKEKLNGPLMAAQIMAVDISPFHQYFVIDRGSKHGLTAGQAVLDAYGVMGQVIAVEPLTARVRLLTDNQSAIPVQLTRSGVRGIVMGNGDAASVSLVNMPKTSEIRRGDLIVTSGLGQRYPQGYPVGEVVDVIATPGNSFFDIKVKPKARIHRSRVVLLVGKESIA